VTMPKMNAFRDLLNDRPQIGLGIFYPAPGIIERLGPDWDWFWIDGQHGELGYGDIMAAVRACNLVDRRALIRVPGHEPGLIGLALDTSADAVMVPMVDDADQARSVVQASKFPPLGSRSFGGRRPIDLYGRGYSRSDQEQPLLVCQIETPQALRNAASIAAVDGVDVIFFSPDDIALRAGMPMDRPRPKDYFNDELRTLAKIAGDHGKFAGGVFPTPESMTQAVDLGYRLVVGAAEVSLLAEASKTKSQVLRECLDGPGPGRTKQRS